MDWLLFIPQRPAPPSALRVTVWRRMHAVGALELQNGVWILPYSPEIEGHVEHLLAHLQENGASGYIFETGGLTPAIENDLLERFRASRDEEYAEFCERGDALLGELAKETALGKFSFAELEEAEEDLRKLEKWLEKISARDCAAARLGERARRKLTRCRADLVEFARKVYASQGVEGCVV